MHLTSHRKNPIFPEQRKEPLKLRADPVVLEVLRPRYPLRFRLNQTTALRIPKVSPEIELTFLFNSNTARDLVVEWEHDGISRLLEIAIIVEQAASELTQLILLIDSP